MDEYHSLQDKLSKKRKYTTWDIFNLLNSFGTALSLSCMYDDEKQEGQQPQTAFLQP